MNSISIDTMEMFPFNDNIGQFAISRSNTAYQCSINALLSFLREGLVMESQGRQNAGKILIVGPDGTVKLKRM